MVTVLDKITALAYTEDVSILIVDDDPEICKLLQKIIYTLGMKVESITNPLQVLKKVKNNFYNIILLDVIMPEMSGIDLLPEIVNLSPDTKIIIITGCADKETAINVLRLGAFDFLEKPFNLELLSHSLNRALETQNIEFERKKIYMDLKQSREDLLTHKLRLEQLNQQFMETNKALSVLAQNIERTRQETEKGIVLKIRSLILPILEKLQQDSKKVHCHAELTMLIRHVENLTSNLGTDIKMLSTITPAELRIASLIKSGLKTEEIANCLYISPATVQTHRKNIRKKLNIRNSNNNLTTYLQSKL